MMDIKSIAVEIHQNACEHGWWESERDLPEVIALCHSELSEALEEYRKGRPMAYVWRPADYPGYQEEDMSKWLPNEKPEGIATEMVDCMIRILDYLEHKGVDVEEILQRKHAYNKGRTYRHGGKRC
jgi:hypothetical protein